MNIFFISLVSATLLVSLVAGFTFAFACVVMPGSGTLGDREFLRYFQVVDRVIQNGQPLFGLVWIGSAIALLVAALAGFGRLEGIDRALLVTATVLFVGGVQVPTATINIPLNNQLQSLHLASMQEAAVSSARTAFERRWNRWNQIRTAVAVLAALLLLVLVLRL